jgi:hypothetical protein
VLKALKSHATDRLRQRHSNDVIAEQSSNEQPLLQKRCCFLSVTAKASLALTTIPTASSPLQRLRCQATRVITHAMKS